MYCAQPGEGVGMEREVSAIITVQSLRHIALISIQRYSTVLLHRGCEKIPGQLWKNWSWRWRRRVVCTAWKLSELIIVMVGLRGRSPRLLIERRSSFPFPPSLHTFYVWGHAFGCKWVDGGWIFGAAWNALCYISRVWKALHHYS